jgi:hypothetical protein
MALDLLKARPGPGPASTRAGQEHLPRHADGAEQKPAPSAASSIRPSSCRTAHPIRSRGALSGRPGHPGTDDAQRPRADVGAIGWALTPDTIMIVGSAPNYPFGVFDPIPELGRLAEQHGLWLHVDACVGGFLAPWVRKLGYDIPPFEFDVPGVSSMSADLHKYGMTAKGASLMLLRDKAQKYQQFEFDNWERGRYARDRARARRPVAAARAVMNYLAPTAICGRPADHDDQGAAGGGHQRHSGRPC